jgi:integrase
LFLSYAHDGGADAASTWISRWLADTAKVKGEKQSLHSFRHSMKDWLREASTPKELADMIQGHTAKDAAGNYGSSQLLEQKLEALKKATQFISEKWHKG